MMILASLLGWLALPIAILRFQIKGWWPLLFCNGLAGGMMAGHYALTGLYSGAAMAGTAALAAFAQLIIGRRLSLPSRIGIAIPAILICIWLSASGISGWIGVLPVVAFTIGRIAETNRDDFWVRFTSLFSTGTWIVYLVIEGSMAGLTFELIGLTSNLIGLARFHRHRVLQCFTKDAQASR